MDQIKHNPRLAVNLGDWQLPNPIIPASGTFGFGYEFSQWYDLNILGSISLKGTTLDARFGNPTPRIAECEGGLLNAIGLQNPGVDRVIAEELPKLADHYQGKVIANISGFSIEEYVAIAQKFDRCDQIALHEINISCPNVKHGGIAFGTSPEVAAKVTAAVKAVVKKPVYIKLSPNVGNIVEIAQACEAAGADGLVLVNTLLGMVIDPRTGKPIVSTKMAGFSGPAIKPIAVRMVYQVYAAVKIPIIGIGGIACVDDVIEFLSAGASAVQIGSHNLIDPYICKTIIETLEETMDRYHIETLTSIIGRAHR